MIRIWFIAPSDGWDGGIGMVACDDSIFLSGHPRPLSMQKPSIRKQGHPPPTVCSRTLCHLPWWVQSVLARGSRRWTEWMQQGSDVVVTPFVFLGTFYIL